MSISISTTSYTKQIPVEIDGVDFKVTPMSSAQTIAYINLCEDLDKAQETEKIKSVIKQLEEILYSVFDKPEEARKVLAKVPIQGVFDIYQKIVAEG